MVYAAHDVLHVVTAPVDNRGNLQLRVNGLLQDRLEKVNSLDLDVLQFADDQAQLPVVIIILVPVGLDQLLGIKPPVILILSVFCLTGNKILSCLIHGFILQKLSAKVKQVGAFKIREAFYSAFCPNWNM